MLFIFYKETTYSNPAYYTNNTYLIYNHFQGILLLLAGIWYWSILKLQL